MQTKFKQNSTNREESGPDENDMTVNNIGSEGLSLSLQPLGDVSRASFSTFLGSSSSSTSHQGPGDVELEKGFHDCLIEAELECDIQASGSINTEFDSYWKRRNENYLKKRKANPSSSCGVVRSPSEPIKHFEVPHAKKVRRSVPVAGCDDPSILLNEGAKPSKIFPGSKAEAEQEPVLRNRGKLKDSVNLVLGSTFTASTSTNRGGQQNNGPSNIRIFEKDASIKGNSEATVHFKKNKAEESQTQLPESRANQQSAAKEIEGGLSCMDAFITEDNIDAFYASLETETTALSDNQINSVFVNTKPSEETQKALQILRDLVSKEFSLLLQPEESKSIKYILEYLLSLSPDDGISLKTKSVILQLSRSFTQWSLDYNEASHKLESAGDDLSKVDELKEGLEANVREFLDAKKFENEILSNLADLEEEKRKLEEQINAIKAQISDYTSSKDTAAQKKRMVFDHGRRLEAQRDDLSIRAPKLRAEQEWAKINQSNIEDEWFKLAEQFIASSSFEDWTATTTSQELVKGKEHVAQEDQQDHYLRRSQRARKTTWKLRE